MVPCHVMLLFPPKEPRRIKIVFSIPGEPRASFSRAESGVWGKRKQQKISLERPRYPQ